MNNAKGFYFMHLSLDVRKIIGSIELYFMVCSPAIIDLIHILCEC
jgi:hypothetical protein